MIGSPKAYLPLADEIFDKDDVRIVELPNDCLIQISDCEFIEIPKGTLIERFKKKVIS